MHVKKQSLHTRAQRAELICTRGDQPNREQRFFNMFINVQLNRENALDMQPTRDRINSTDNSGNWFQKPNQESNSLLTIRQTLIVKINE